MLEAVMAVFPDWRRAELCEAPLQNGATALVKVERAEFGGSYWRLYVADGSRIAPISGGSAASADAAKRAAWDALRIALATQLEDDGQAMDWPLPA
jgi:hypothetical protein